MNDTIKTVWNRIKFLKRKITAYKLYNDNHIDWNSIISKDRDLYNSYFSRAKKGLKILIATSTGAHLDMASLESTLAVALTLKGANANILLCDGVLPACMMCEIRWYPDAKYFSKYGPNKDYCKMCFLPAYKMFKTLGLPVYGYSNFLSNTNRKFAEDISSSLPVSDISSYRYEGIPIGEHSLAGALRFFARGNLETEQYGEPILRRYLEASLLSLVVMRNLLNKINIERAVFHHGIYVPQGIIGEVLRDENVKVVNWNPAYRKNCFIFSHNHTYHQTLMSEPISTWSNLSWSPSIEKATIAYLKSRQQGTHDWIKFHKNPKNDVSRELGINFSKPCIGLLTNVIWDAQLHYPENIFKNMLDWLFKTIVYFKKRPELQLIIRIHPAEVSGTIPSRQLVGDEITKTFPTLPDNVFIISPESPISTYKLMSLCNSVIIYGTKMGVELSSMGIPVIVAGEAWIRNKQITIDPTSQKNYFQVLDELPLNNNRDPKLLLRSLKYAYHFFFRRMIPLGFTEPCDTGKSPIYKIDLSTIKDLLPNRDLGLDVICDGILENKEFIYPAEN